MRKAFIFWFVALYILMGCGKEDASKVLLPSDLVVTKVVSESEEGLVEVTAFAQSVNYFAFEFFDINGSEIQENSEGKASYKYSQSGTYKFVVRAHTTFDQFISLEDSVTIVIAENPSGFPKTGYMTPLSYPDYNLVWHDEFDGHELSDDWVHDLGTGNSGWGNNELQFYRKENAEVRDGALVITAKREAVAGQQFTSSRVKTQGKQSFQYGRIDIRAALPQGKGIWPATWMLGNSFATDGWPFCGEIDIMEMVGGPALINGDRSIHGTAHWANANGNHAFLGAPSTLSNGVYADEWHVFSIVWDSQKIIWYRDDIKYFEFFITMPDRTEFHQPFFLIFNVAVGGNWPGSPDATTVFPQRMAVDYVRVFQK
jgi:beta-glucanase (GH16 family)